MSGKNHLPPDQASRDAIRSQLGICVWVEAGAGSGKTTELVNRLVNLIVDKGVPLDEIAAITFTKKAAGELKTRVQDGIERAYRNEAAPEKKARLEKALGSMESLFAETIHAFCMQILRERPIEARVPPDFDLMEDAEDAMIRARVLHGRLERLRRDNAVWWEQLRAAGIGPREMELVFETLCEHAEVDFPPGAAEMPDLPHYAEGIRGVVEAMAPLRAPSPVSGNTPLLDRFLELKKYVDNGRFEDPAALYEALKQFEYEDPRGRVPQGWASVGARTQANSIFSNFRDGSAVHGLRAWRGGLYRQVIEILTKPPGEGEVSAREQVLQERLATGRLVQNDLLRLTARLLRQHPDVRRHLAKRFKYLFVDEFQDTDPVQAEIMFFIAGDSDSEDWTEQKPRPGSLFVVGDPKQSIYRFRRADIAVYQQVRALMLAAGAVEAPLTASFRSHAPVCEWVNAGFERVFPKEGTEQQAAFAPLNPEKPAIEGYSSGALALNIPNMRRGHSPNYDQIPAFEAESIAKYIRKALDDGMKISDRIEGKPALRPVHPGDFMIISRGKKVLPVFSDALERYGIPNEVKAADSGEYWDGIGVFRALLKAVADPDDEVSIVACLRGPLFGMSDVDLFQFKDGGGRFRLSSVQEGESAVHAALQALHACWKAGRTQSPGTAVEMILEDSGILARFGCSEEGGALLAGFQAAASYIRKAGVSGMTFADAAVALEEAFDGGDEDGFGLPPLSYGPKKVRVMNLHKAKGLEAGIVFLVQPNMKTSHAPTLHIRRDGRKVEGFLQIAVKVGEHGSQVLAEPEDWPAHSQAEDNFNSAEKDRQNYVAVTRAKDLLVVSKSDGGIASNFLAFGKLNDMLGNLPALAVPESVAVPAVEAESVSYQSIERGIKAFSEGMASKAAPSFSVESVTERLKEHAYDRPKGEKPKKGEGPRGAEWGIMIHRILEHLARNGERPEGDALRVRVEELIEPDSPFLDAVDYALPLVQNALESEIWERMLKSPERYTEVPVQRFKDGVVTSGVIDLIYRVDDAWELVDWKTDSVVNDALVGHYTLQLNEYCEWWGRCSGEDIVRKGLYFLRSSRVRWC